jgi:hypothetical protein
MKGRNTAVGGLIFAIGLIGGLIGFMTDAYSSTVAVLIMLGVWFIGGALAAIMLRSK